MAKRKPREPETRPMVYDGCYGGFVPVENASFDVSTTPDAIVEMPRPEEPEPVAKRPKKPALRCDACRQRKRTIERCSDGVLVVCRTCAHRRNVRSLPAVQAIEQIVAATPAGERTALRRQLETRLAIRLKRRDRKVGSALSRAARTATRRSRSPGSRRPA